MIHLRDNGPDALLFGQPITLESVASGTLEKPPGPWAQHLKRLNYTVAKQGIVLKTLTLVTLDEKEPKRELMVRNNRPFTPSSLEHNIGESATKVEAALGYVVGDLAGEPCQRCERGLGPFPHCVRVPDCKYMTACVNCHWNADDAQCREFHVPLPGESDPSSHKSLAKRVLDSVNSAVDSTEESCANCHQTSVQARHVREVMHEMGTAIITEDRSAAIESYRKSAGYANALASTIEEQAIRLHQQLTELQKLREMVAKAVKDEEEETRKRERQRQREPRQGRTF